MTPEGLDRISPSIRAIARDVVNDGNPLRHDPDKLARALLEIAREDKGIERAPAEVPAWTASQPVGLERVLATSSAAKE